MCEGLLLVVVKMVFGGGLSVGFILYKVRKQLHVDPEPPPGTDLQLLARKKKVKQKRCAL